MPRVAFCVPICLAILGLSGRAPAQQAAADALFDSARAAMAKGNLPLACEQFRASDQLDPAVGTELNLADCEEQRGRLATAWELYRTVAEKLPVSDERLALARSRAESLSGRVPKLTLELAPGAPKTSAVRDGQVELGAAAFGVALPLDPGAHELLVFAPGFEARAFQIQLREGGARTLVVSPGGPSTVRDGTAPPGSDAPSTKEESRTNPSGTRRLGFALGGVGVAGWGVAAVAGVLVLGRQHIVDAQCHPDKSCSSAGLAAANSGHKLQVVSNVGWVAGALALGAGAYFLFSDPSPATPRTSLSLSSNIAGAQLALTRSW